MSQNLSDSMKRAGIWAPFSPLTAGYHALKGLTDYLVPSTDGEVFSGSRSSAASLNKPRWAKIIDSGGADPVRHAWEEQTFTRLAPGQAVSIGLMRADAGLTGTVNLNPVVSPGGGEIGIGSYVLVRAEYFDPTYDVVFSLLSGTGAQGPAGPAGPGSEVEFIRIKDAAANGDGTFNARVVDFAADGTVNAEVETIWGRDVNQLTTLIDEGHYIARKTSDSYNGRRVFTLEDSKLSVANTDYTQLQLAVLYQTFSPKSRVTITPATSDATRAVDVYYKSPDIVDLHSGTTYADVWILRFDSTPTAYDNTKGDYVFTWDSTNHILTVRLNGHYGSARVIEDCFQGNLRGRTWDIRNGLVKTIGPLS